MPRGYDPVHTRPFAMIPNGVVAALDAPEDAAVAIETVMGSFSFTPAEIPFGRSKSFLDGAALVERTAPTVDFTSGESYNDYAALAAAGDGSVWLSWIGYKNEKDAVWLARHGAGGWGKPIRVSPQGEYTDNFRAAVAEAADGRIVVVWSGKSPSGEWGIFSRILDGGALSGVAVVGGASQNLYHRVTTDGKGGIHVVWQGFRDRVSKILHARWDGSAWSGETVVSGPEGDNWAPDIAADSKGNVWVGWDGYAAGDFNVYVRRLNAGGSWDGIRQITASPAFEANAALACDANDRLWIAWDHGEANWGKDWSSQRFKPGGGAGLYRTRAVKVAVLDGKRLKQPPALMDAIPAEAKDYVQQARLQTDADGNLWAMVRSLTSTTTRVNNNWGAGGIWEMLLTRLDPSGWTPAVKLHATNGRNDVWASSALSAGGKLWFAWSRDARPFGSPARAGNRPTPAAQTTHIAYTTLDPSATAWRSAGQPRLAPFREAAVRAAPVHANEAADTAAIRSYRYEAGGKSYRILRGDLHRHTDISSDGIGEGGLIDFYRYAITAGSYDFMMVADHQFGGDTVPGVEYNWWRTEKSEDIFLVPGRFWPLFGTERSLPYPNGHRNTVFARRGIHRLPIQAGERNAVINTGDVLYPYLRRHGGITTGHTSGTDQGTDWRDSDPRSRAHRRNLPGSPRLLRVPRRAARRNARQTLLPPRRGVAPGRLRLGSMGQGNQDRRAGKLRSRRHARCVCLRAGSRRQANDAARPAGRDARAPHLRRNRQHRRRCAHRRSPDGRSVCKQRTPSGESSGRRHAAHRARGADQEQRVRLYGRTRNEGHRVRIPRRCAGRGRELLLRARRAVGRLPGLEQPDLGGLPLTARAGPHAQRNRVRWFGDERLDTPRFSGAIGGPGLLDRAAFFRTREKIAVEAGDRTERLRLVGDPSRQEIRLATSNSPTAIRRCGRFPTAAPEHRGACPADRESTIFRSCAKSCTTAVSRAGSRWIAGPSRTPISPSQTCKDAVVAFLKGNRMEA